MESETVPLVADEGNCICKAVPPVATNAKAVPLLAHKGMVVQPVVAPAKLPDIQHVPEK